MGVNGKNKGNKAERMVAKWFSNWTGYEFSRVPMSGGLRWKKTDNISGDLTCSDPKHSRYFQLCVESKSYNDLDWDKLFRNKKAQIQKFWEQCKSDSDRANKVPILFMRKNGMDKDMFYVFINYKTWKIIRSIHNQKFTYPIVIINGGELNDKVVLINSGDLQKVDYKSLHKQLKTLTRC